MALRTDVLKFAFLHHLVDDRPNVGLAYAVAFAAEFVQQFTYHKRRLALAYGKADRERLMLMA